jgi:PadR family transcriptional regulator, regulatory protein PadR
MSNTFISPEEPETIIMKNEEESGGMCDMRGMLSFMILWMLSSRSMCGQELADELGKRRGDKPNPGTIYPALKELANRGLIKSHSEGRTLVYELTASGKSTLSKSLAYFERVFGDILDETGARASMAR